MNQHLLETLLQITDPTEIMDAIAQHQLTIATIGALKACSAQYYTSQPGEAVRVAELAYQLSLPMPAPAPALGRWTLANALVYTAHYADALPLFAQACAEYHSVGDLLNAARLSVGYIIVLAFTGKMEQALALAAASEPILTASGAIDPDDLWRLGNLLMNVALIYEALGDYEEALTAAERQAQIAHKLNDPFMLAQLKHNQACVLAQLNSWDAALDIFKEAEVLFAQEEASADMGRLYTNQARLLSNMRRYAEAEEALHKAAQLIAGVPGADQQRHWLALQRATLALKSQTPITPSIIDFLNEAREAFARHGNLTEEGLAWLILGQCQLQREMWSDAAHAFAQIRQLVDQGADRSLGCWAWHGMALLAAAQNNHTDALRCFEAALAQIEDLRQGLNVELFRAAFLADKLVIYQDFVQLHLERGDLEQAFYIVERAKSRLLTEKLTFQLSAQLSARSTWLGAANDEQTHSLNRQFSDALHQLDVLYRQARFAAMQQGHESPVASSTQTADLVTALEQEVQHLLGELQRREPRFAATATGGAVKLNQILPHLQQLLLLQYHVVQDVVCLFVVNQDGIQNHYRLAALTDVESACEKLALALERTLELARQLGLERMARYMPALLADAQKHLHTLYKLLFQPFSADLPADAALMIVLDGSLHSLPFHALYDGQSYLIEQRAISYTPSATVMDLCLQQRTQTTDICLIGYDNQALQAISQEMTALQHIFPSAEQWSGATATTEQFLAKGANYRLLHLATHARFRADNPVLSAIALADRSLTLADIMRLQLDADLVVLSGCETGSGKLFGADLFSLAGGFLGAGARSLLVSLWRVEDVITAHLMQHFYQATLQGQSRSVALQSAQVALLSQAGPAATYHRSIAIRPFGRLSSYLVIGGQCRIR